MVNKQFSEAPARLKHTTAGMAHADHDGIAPMDGDLLRYNSVTGKWECAAPAVFTSALKGLVPASGGGTANFMRADGTWAAPAGGGGGPTLLRKTAIQTINGNAFQNIAGLTLAVAANTTYHFVFYIVFRSAATTTGFGFSVNGPAQSLLDYVVHYQTTANAALTADVTQRKDTAYDAMAAVTATITAAVNLRCRIEGIVRTTAAGTFAARVRSELANNDLTVQAESIGIITTFT